MSVNFQNNPDGTLEIVDVNDSDKVIMKIGGGGLATSVAPNYRGSVWLKFALNASDTAGGVFSFTNNTSFDMYVGRVIIDVTTASSAACTIAIGTNATSTATSSNNLIDGLSVAATGVFNNGNNGGTAGKEAQKLAAGDFLTGSVASGASSGLVGTVLVEYIVS